LKYIILSIFALILVGCDVLFKYESECQFSESYITIKTNRNGEYYQKVSFDSSGGVSFNGVSTMKSATDIRNNLSFTYDVNSQLLKLEFKKSERLINNLNRVCVNKLQSFFVSNNVKVNIELIGN
jgi:hypothetical protein